MASSPSLRIAVILIVLVNAWGALPTLHYAPWADLSRDDVRVYTPHGTSPDRIPIQGVYTAISQDPFAETGQTVNVYVRSGYRNSGAQTYPRITLCIVAIAVLLAAFGRATSTRI